MKAIAVTNQKGGVAKTTTALNLAVALTRAGHGVLVVDLDPQANLTTQAGFDVRQKRLSVYDVLVNKTPMADVIEQGSLGFWVAPSDEILMRAEMEMGDKNLGWVRELRKALEPVRSRFDYCLFDTPPVRGFLTVNALVAADLVLAPVSAGDEGAAQGLAELRATIEKLKRLRPALPELQVIITKWQPRRIMSDVIAQAIAELGAEPIAHIPARALVERAAIERAPIALLAPDNSVSIAYQDLAEQLLAAPTR